MREEADVVINVFAEEYSPMWRPVLEGIGSLRSMNHIGMKERM